MAILQVFNEIVPWNGDDGAEKRHPIARHHHRRGCGDEYALESGEADAQEPEPHQFGHADDKGQQHQVLHPAGQFAFGNPTDWRYAKGQGQEEGGG